MDEIDQVWEIGVAPDENYWVTEKEWLDIIDKLGNVTSKFDLIEFTTSYNMKVMTFAFNIRTLNTSTKKQRDNMRHLNKQYRAQEIEEKKEWEE
jgi:hypothetical protein